MPIFPIRDFHKMIVKKGGMAMFPIHEDYYLQEYKQRIQDINKNGWKYAQTKKGYPLYCKVPLFKNSRSCQYVTE